MLTFFASYPRCGVHWMMTMCIIATDRSRWTHSARLFLFNGQPYFLKTHVLPTGVGLHNSRNIVYTYRHGKDAVLAYSKFLHNVKVERGEITQSYSTEWLWRCLKEECLAEKWAEHVESFFDYNQRVGNNFHPIKFEDVLYNPVKELKRVLKFTGLKPSRPVTYSMIEMSVASAPIEDETVLTGTITGFHKGANWLHYGESTPEERVKVFTHRWEGFKYWTKEIDELVNSQIGDTLEKYGYEK